MTGVEIALAEFPPADEEGHLAVGHVLCALAESAIANQQA